MIFKIFKMIDLEYTLPADRYVVVLTERKS